MGTPAEREHRERARLNRQRIEEAGASGQWTTDAQLAAYLQSIGLKPDGPMYNQIYSRGGYATYGPSWNPNLNYNFETDQNIPWQGQNPQDFPWYDPTVASNWQDTDPTVAARMRGFYNWRDQNLGQGLNIDQNYGGNAFVAWLRGRANSGSPNAPDMSWTGQNWGNPGGAGYRGPTLGGLAGAKKTPASQPAPAAPRPVDSREAPNRTLGDLAQPQARAGPWNDWRNYGL